MACDVFKIINKLCPDYIYDSGTLKTSSYDFRGERRADIPLVSTTRYGLKSLMSEAPGSGTAFQIVCRSQNHTRSSEGCAGAGKVLVEGAL